MDFALTDQERSEILATRKRTDIKKVTRITYYLPPIQVVQVI